MLRADAIAAASGESERQALAVPRRQKLEELHADAYMSIDAIKALPCCAIGEEGSEMAIADAVTQSTIDSIRNVINETWLVLGL